MARTLRVVRSSLPRLVPDFVPVTVTGGRVWVAPDVVWADAHSLPENRHIASVAANRYRALIRLTPNPPAVLVFASWMRDIINVRIKTA